MATSGKSWEWHNTEVGVGYQAKHVVRQKSFAPITDKIIDMRGPVPKRLSNCAGLSTTVEKSTKCKSGTYKEEPSVEKSTSLASIDKKKLKKMEKKSRRKEEKVAKAARKEMRKEKSKDKKKD